MDRTSNDNGKRDAAEAAARHAAHGRAAILLVESLVHGLIGRDILSLAEAIDVAESAVTIASEEFADAPDQPETRQALGLLEKMSHSLRGDLRE